MGLREVFVTNPRRLRHARGASQDDLAYDAGVSRSSLSQLEMGGILCEPEDRRSACQRARRRACGALAIAAEGRASEMIDAAPCIGTCSGSWTIRRPTVAG